MKYNGISGLNVSNLLVGAAMAVAELSMGPIRAAEPSAPMATPSAAALPLRYRWQEGESYRYHFSIEATALERGVTVTGVSSYTAKRPEKSAELKTSSSGSAFVVAADGYLLTCNHVVSGANRIEVLLEGRTYDAKVVVSDSGLDVALLKIEADGLTSLAMADSKNVELGKEVRSVGYPLLELLGESVKINRGSVAGFVRVAGQEFLQIDVSINPGNSGGPVVDDSGNVVGVASQKLYGPKISNVGFCVPANEICDWLKSKSAIRVERVASGKTLSGTDLAKKVTGSVALLKVTGGGDVWELHSRSSLAGALGSQFDSGKVTAKESGEVVDDKDVAALPMMLGPIVTLTVDPIDSTGRQEWKSERQLIVIRQKEEPRTSLLSPALPGIGGRRYSIFGFDERPRITAEFSPATEVAKYKILESSDTVVKISKMQRLTTDERQRENIDLSLSGTLVFDRERGVMQSAALEGKYTLASENVTVRIPLKVSYRPFTKQEEETVRGTVRSPKPAEAPPQPDPLVQAELKKLDENADRQQTLQALQALLAMKRDKPSRAAVVEKVALLLKSPDSEVRAQTLKTLAQWDWSTKLSDVIPLLKDEDQATRKAAIFYLGEMQDGDAAPALCEHLLRSDDRDLVIAALKGIGAAAEDAVVDLLKHQDPAVRIAACQILAEIGSADVVQPLRRLVLAKDAAAAAGQDALDKLGYSAVPPPPKRSRSADDDENPFGSAAKRKIKPTDDDENPFEQPKPKN